MQISVKAMLVLGALQFCLAFFNNAKLSSQRLKSSISMSTADYALLFDCDGVIVETEV
jgi:hypothetical protein